MAVAIESGRKILFIGDSITDCGRREAESPLGAGYVKLFGDMVTIREPEKYVEIVNTGIGGNTIKDLQGRWDTDMLNHKPDWLSVKIGINDLHRFLCKEEQGKLSRFLHKDTGSVSPDEFAEIYDNLLSRTVAALPRCELLLIDPFYICNDAQQGSFEEKVLGLIPEYIRIVHEMSEKYSTRLVKTHEIFANFLKYQSADVYCPEPIHPNATGHMLIAEAVYTALSG